MPNPEMLVEAGFARRIGLANQLLDWVWVAVKVVLILLLGLFFYIVNFFVQNVEVT